MTSSREGSPATDQRRKRSREDSEDENERERDSIKNENKQEESPMKNKFVANEANEPAIDDNNDSNTQKVDSVVGAVVNTRNYTPKNMSRAREEETFRSDTVKESHAHSIEEKKALIEDTYKKPEILGRNKRMFGSLMGHLGLAKVKLEKESQKIREQQQYVNDVAKKREEENQRQQMERKKEVKLSMYEKKVQQIKDSSNCHRDYLESLQNFIFTTTEPRLPWLPANQNKLSRELLSKRQEEVIRDLAEREIEENKKIQECNDWYQREINHIEMLYNKHNSHGDKESGQVSAAKEDDTVPDSLVDDDENVL